MNESVIRLAMFISGSGSTMQAIGKQCQDGTLQGLVEPVVVFSSRPDAKGIQKAEVLGIPVEVVQRRDFTRGYAGLEPFGQELCQRLARFNPDVITQNGWMVLTPKQVIAAYEDKIFNQHPGPVPEFGGQGMFGRRVHTAALLFNRLTARKPQETMMIAQKVHPDYDKGAVVRLERVAILPHDTPNSLQQRALPIEHQVQIALLENVAKGQVVEEPPIRFTANPGDKVILFLAKEAGKALYPEG